MATSYESFQKKRLRTSYTSVVISISLVLFMLGILGLVVLQSSKVANHFREEIVISLFLKDDAKETDIVKFKEDLLREDYVKTINYVTKEDAIKELGEEFTSFLGKNPLKNLIDLHLKAKYVTSEQMTELEQRFNRESFIYEISYDKVLIEKLEENIKKISFWLLVVSGFFGVISILLINSSIRLSIYAKRFNIKTMQMVGATKRFIRKPFILQSLRLGIVGALIALAALAAIVYYINLYVPTFGLLEDYELLFIIGAGILLTSLFITWICTFFAAQRFLNLRSNELYE